jgi:hypothetical protein
LVVKLLRDTFTVQVLRPPYGVLYVAAKKHYYGVGGGTRQFKALLDEDGKFSHLAGPNCRDLG